MIDDDRARRFQAAVRRPAVLATVATLSLALILGGLVWTTAGTPGSSPEASSGAAAASHGWASLAPSATAGQAGPAGIPLLSASGMQGGVVPLDTGFRLESIDGTPASTLAAAMTVEPEFAFASQPEDGDRAVIITPTEPLHPGFVYRFALHGATGELLETWAFQASQPVRVVGTIPENQATDVPLRTGIEVIFDQDGIVDATSHITIAPATDGRFEQHGRTIAFVPDRPLKPATAYSVVVSAGVTVEGTGEASVEDTRIRFETVATSDRGERFTFMLQDELIESAVADRPVIGLSFYEPDEGATPKTTPIEVYDLGGLEDGIAAFRTIRTRPDWARWSTEGIVDAAGLHRVVAIDGRVIPYRGEFFVRLPEALDAGWYLVQLPHDTRPFQAVLQVTDVAGYLSLSDTRTLTWANDLASGKAVAGAAVAADGVSIGTTDADGLAMGATPSGVLPDPAEACDAPCDPVVTVTTSDGRAIFLPTTTRHDKLEFFGDGYYWSEADRTYWALLHSDRLRYRPTDTVNVWGVIRRRDDGVVPSAVTLRLVPETYDAVVRPATVTMPASPGSAGAFAVSMTLAGVAEGGYQLILEADGRAVRTTYLRVGAIVKPAYQLDVVTGHRVYIADDRIRITVDASFFEGTPVPGVPLRIDGYVERTVRTNAAGQAIHRTTAVVESDQEGPRTESIGVAPARAEEGEITGASRDIVIFPSSRTLAADATIQDGRVKVSGDVHLVDVAGLESDIADGASIWELDPRGAPVRNAVVTLRFVELIPVRILAGNEYDFIEKRVVPVYETRIDERSRGEVQVRTAADGSFDASIAASKADHDYRIVATVGDLDGNRDRHTMWASSDPWEGYDSERAFIAPTQGETDGTGYGIGDPVDLTMTDPDHPQSGGASRYLFTTAQRGLRDATVQASPRFRTTFESWAAPNMAITGIRFTTDGYVAAGFDVHYRTSDRHLSVDLTAGATRYGPGDTATVAIRTRDATGTGTAATVILRAVDEKLFRMGAATADDPLEELYATVGTGLVGGYMSHLAPAGETGGGDTTGGGGEGGDTRDDFRDVVLFRTVDTDVNGRASVTFPVPDDLTSWRVSGSAITTGLEAGYGSVLVPVGLPFFVDATLAREYLVADRPSIPVRVFGSAISPGDATTIQVAAPGLGFDSGAIGATAFETTLVDLPALKAGVQTITITARTGSGTSEKVDRLQRTFKVVSTRLTTPRSAYAEASDGSSYAGGPGLTSVLIADAGGGRYLSLLTELAAGGGARLDRGLAADIATDLLTQRFGVSSDRLPEDRVDAGIYQRDGSGVALLPYSSVDLDLSSLVALTAPDRVGRQSLANYLNVVRSDAEETRERRMFALAGLAALGEPVLPAIRAAAVDPELTVRERLMIGIGAARIGDSGTARDIADALRDEFGEQAGPMARLRVGTTAADSTAATSLMAVLAAAIGDDQAPAYLAYVEANPIKDQLHVLESASVVSDLLTRLPVEHVSFRYTVDGDTKTVELEPGQALELSLDAARLANLRVEPVTGSVGVTTSWLEPITPRDLARDPDVTIKRVASPTGTVEPADLVKITLTVRFGPQAASGCHDVTELVPSGLTPVGPSDAWHDEEDGGSQPLAGVVLPYDTSGARVSFCAEPTAKQRVVQLRYYARVVNPGTFAWEPAVAPSQSQVGAAARTSSGTITIRP